MQDASYHLAVFGSAPEGFIDALTEEMKTKLSILSLELGKEVAWYVGPPGEYDVHGGLCTAALCFPLENEQIQSIVTMMKSGMPVIPVASSLAKLGDEFAAPISTLNGLGLSSCDIPEIANCLLECASLLPRQRRVFLSYRRSESTHVALQLYAALSERLFDVFLDTHEILPGQHFQEVLWQKLCDSDVMVYLDTEGYFKSRWTTSEFGRATWRAIPIQRVGWPGVALDPRSLVSGDLRLEAADFEADGQSLTPACLHRICSSVESLRAEGVATRYHQLIDAFRASLQRSRATIEGYSMRRTITVKTRLNEYISVYPTLGVPTTYTLHEATLDNHTPPVAVVYDDVGIDEKRWVTHMEWIGGFLNDKVRLIKPYSSGWHFEDWRQ
ncbi:toll/interleukin-1 receptor domain-containing protein [Pseudomonas sp. S3E12]|uniref:toll/interleukin-1 receptor domain-containing protein n=1 Tax=Pseudomonas sp. S3E12 TaxID=1873126 RepID=UPI00081BEE50|nr:toll/interleukin-1 receptor domain-containing protein [Pseudomonas sp. S3E12]OCW20438.1 hypothetical protein BB029_26785 [Pseudomonas sp. S3E12]